MQNGARSRGGVDPITHLVRSLEAPISGPFLAASNEASDSSANLIGSGNLIAENRRLKALELSLLAYQANVDDLQSEIDTLRRLQGFGAVPGKTRVNALVIGYAPYENLITVSAGTDKGIHTGSPVISARGLVGTVLSVEANRCQVMLLSNQGLTIGAIDVTRKPPSAGLFKNLTLTFQDPQAPVEVGDLVVTSGFSDKIPRSIIIGKVIFVDDSQELGTRRALVDPAVSIGDLREVQILQ
ncbi:rod shape-determining protein MreC [soil metagenome]